MRFEISRGIAAAALLVVFGGLASCGEGSSTVSGGSANSEASSEAISEGSSSAPAVEASSPETPGNEAPGAGSDDGDLVAGGPSTPCLLEADVVAAATGVPMAVTSGAEACGYTGPEWEVSIHTGELGASSASTTAPSPSQTIPGLGVRNWVTHPVALERGGRFHASVSMIEGSRWAELGVWNNTGGSDTYPPTDGPPQRPLTAEVFRTLAEALAGELAT